MSLTFDDVVAEVSGMMRAYGGVTPRQSYLTEDMADDALTFTVADASGFSTGITQIDAELVEVASIDTDANTVTIFPGGRGYGGTTALAHTANARVTADPDYPLVRLQAAINDTIIGTYPDLFGVGNVAFTYNVAIQTYMLDATALDILKVTTDTLGPSKRDDEINRYDFNGSAPTAKWTSGKTLTLQEFPEPGRTVTIWYSKIPTALADGDDFTSSGLSESAKRCIVYGTLANLTATIDPGRLESSTATEFELSGTRNSVGIATQLSNNLRQVYLLELENEKRRQRQTFPFRVRIGARH